MGHSYGQVMFGAAAKKLQEQHGSRAAYERLAALGENYEKLRVSEKVFVEDRDSFYIASVTADGWPYVQHRGGPAGFLKVIDDKTLAFADFAGNKQYVTTGNFATDDKVSLFLMDYALQARLKVIGHARIVELGQDPQLEARVTMPQYKAKTERVVVIDIVAFDWNCSQHITQRWTREEWKKGPEGGLSA